MPSPCLRDEPLDGEGREGKIKQRDEQLAFLSASSRYSSSTNLNDSRLRIGRNEEIFAGDSVSQQRSELAVYIIADAFVILARVNIGKFMTLFSGTCLAGLHLTALVPFVFIVE